jgi:hypothetical protein
MVPASEGTRQGGVWRLTVAALLFATVAPVASAAVPLAGLLAVSRPRRTAELVVGAVSAGFGMWWLLQPGQLPEQLLRAAVLFTTIIFVIVSVRSPLALTNRALIAVVGALAGVAVLLTVLGSSWGELRWWVEHQAGLEARVMIAWLGLLGGASPEGAPGIADQVADWFAASVPMTANYFPAVTALQLLVGLALAAAVYYRVARNPVGKPPATFRLFRFTEHLGWAAVVPLALVLIPKLAAVKLTAMNLLVVTAALYALRGAAVATFGLAAVGAGGFLLWTLLTVVFILILPVVVGGAIVLGVLDAGVDFRRRWMTPRVGR